MAFFFDNEVLSLNVYGERSKLKLGVKWWWSTWTSHVRNFPEKSRFSSVIVNSTYVVIVPANIASMYM